MDLRDRLRLIGHLVRLRPRPARDRDAAWNSFWTGVAGGRLTEAVLWEGGVDAEAIEHVDRVAPWFTPELPVVDAGCGTGWLAAALAARYPTVVGVDVADDAVALARQAHPGTARFTTADLTDRAAAIGLHAELGDCHVVVRGVLHVLREDQQHRLVASLRTLAGDRGRVFLVETNVPGGALTYLRAAGADADGIPGPLAQAIRTLPRPGHLGPGERSALFPAAQWELLADGDGRFALASGSEVDSYWAVLQPR